MTASGWMSASATAWTWLAEATQRQTILETVDLDKRLKHLIHFLMHEITRCEKEEGK